MTDYKELVDRLRKAWEPHDTDEGCANCPVSGCSTKGCALLQAADAIENLLNDIHARKAVAEGLMYLNGQLSLAAAEKAEDIRNLQEENRRLNSENFWLCKGGNNENFG